MTVEVVGLVVGIIGAIWMKSAMGLLSRERENPDKQLLRPNQESPAVHAFVRGLSLVLMGLGIETFARLFLSY